MTPTELLQSWLERVAAPGGAAWLDATCARIAAGDRRAFRFGLGQAGRRVGRDALNADATAAQAARPGWDPRAWSADQAARTLLVLALPADPPAPWLAELDAAFASATVEEQVALYQALPLLPHAQLLPARAAAGVRSSLTPVFAAVALDNPYPAERMDDDAFAQLVLKAFFCGLPSARISGLDRRLTPDLGRMLAHYAHERRLASRPVDPALPPLARACGADCPD